MKIFGISALFLLFGGAAFAQQTPHLAYVYPAGGKIGSTFQIVVGGQNLMTVSNAFVTGPGIRATVLDASRPMNFQEFQKLRDRLKELQEKFQANRRGNPGTNGVWTAADAAEREQIREKILKNPPNRTANPAMIDKVIVTISIATNVAPGDREIRLATPNALSNPLRFCIGTLPEITKPAAKPTNPDLDKFLGHFTPRSRIKEAVTLLLNARELEFTRVGDRSLIQMPADVVKPRETLSRRS